MACQALSEFSPAAKDPNAPLLPSLKEARAAADHIALRVAEHIMKEKKSPLPQGTDIKNLLKEHQWEPVYLPYRYRIKK